MKESTLLVPALPAKPIAPYVGGKRNLADRIIERIRRTPHDFYGEAFMGMGGVFFRRPYRAQAEVINDYSRDVATTMRVLQRHYVPFVDMIRWQLSSRAEFQRLLSIDPATLTDLERAARFIYVQRLGFGGKVKGRTFGVHGRTASFDVTKLVPMLEAAHDRLAGVTIECLPWAEFLDRYDRPRALFYLDPPYWGTEDVYGPGMFERAQFEQLAARLARLRGRFILSINDVPEIRRLFRRFRIEAVATTYTIAGGKRSEGAGGQAKELVISGPIRSRR